MISLKKLLDIPRFSDLKVITDSDTLSNHQIIGSVEITETPDVANYIPKNVLILSTAMAFQENSLDLIPFIESLVEAQAAGLAIKLNRFLKTIDPAVIHYANEMNFPLVIIPDHYRLGSLLHQMMNLVWQTEREEIEFALDVQKKFSNLLLQEASNDLLVNEFSQMIESPIILLDPFQEIMTQSRHFNDRMTQADYYLDLLFEKIAQTGREEGTFLIEQEDGSKRNIFLMKIYVHKYFPHSLIIFDSEQLPFPTSIFAIDQAALVFQFNLFKNEKVDETLYANEAYFFDGLIDRQLADSYNVKNWFQVSRDYGYIDSDYYQVINIHTCPVLNEQTNSIKANEKALLSYRWLRENIDNYFNNALVVWRAENQESILILQEEPNDIQSKLETIANKINQTLDSQLTFSVGRAFPHWDKIEKSYVQANLAYNENQNERVTFYRDKGMYQLFNDMNNNEIVYFCKKTLKDLAYPDEDDDMLLDLRHTLDVYLANQCEITKTAQKLYIHRNTVKYRINRCEEILGVTVCDPEVSLNLRLALNLSKIDL